MAVVLDEIVDEEYEPLEQEIREYAEWLGMNPEEDRELLWVARDGLKAPLPAEWKPCQSGGGDIFYFNFQTGESVWDHPCDDRYRRLYRHAKARLNAPVKVVNIEGTYTMADMLTVRCIGSFNGEELAVFNLKPAIKVRAFRAGLAKKLEISRRRLRIFLPDGRLVADEDDQSLLASTLGLETERSETDIHDKEELIRQKRAVRAKEYLDRCQNLAGLGVDPEAQAAIDEMLPEIPGSEEETTLHSGKSGHSGASQESRATTTSMRRESTLVPAPSAEEATRVDKHRRTFRDKHRYSLEQSDEYSPQQIHKPSSKAGNQRIVATKMEKPTSKATSSCDSEVVAKTIVTGNGEMCRQSPFSLRLRAISPEHMPVCATA